MSSYYKLINGRRYDRQLLEKAQSLTEGRGDGRISLADARALLEAVQDGRGITEVEKQTLAYLLQHFNWTDKAEEWFSGQLQLPSFREQLEHIILEEFHLLRLRLQLDEEELRRQTALPLNAISPGDALRAALASFLEDGESPESPRRLAMNIYELWPGEVPHAEALLDSRLREHMDAGEIRLLPAYETLNEDDIDFNPPAEGEPSAENWIFGLSLPELSDHYFWAIVDRRGQNPSYNYGFN